MVGVARRRSGPLGTRHGPGPQVGALSLRAQEAQNLDGVLVGVAEPVWVRVSNSAASPRAHDQVVVAQEQPQAPVEHVDPADVIVHGRDEERAARVLRQIEALGVRVRFESADLSDPTEVTALAERAGEVDVNISNGAATTPGAGSGVYGATTAALEPLTRVWAAEFGPAGYVNGTVLSAVGGLPAHG